MDGDGQYEIFLKWDPSDQKDNSQSGVTSNVYIDAYRLKIWMIHEQSSGASATLRELLDGNHVDKYGTGGDTRLLTGSGAHSVNGTKSTPSLSGDLFGDWREEIILPRDDNAALRIYATPTQTDRRIYTLMHDAQHRVAIAWQNTAPPQPNIHVR